MTIKQISVFVENKAGQLSNFVDVLSENDIDMRALSLPKPRILALSASLWMILIKRRQSSRRLVTSLS